MRLKEIKPGMVIHCKTEEEANALMVELNKLGYTWGYNVKPTHHTNWKTYREETCYRLEADTFGFANKDYYATVHNITEFSDLIIPELSAKEVLETIGEICSLHHNCELDNCPLYLNHKSNLCQNKMLLAESEKVVDICTKWREEHPKEEKKVEVEQFWEIKCLEDPSYHTTEHYKDEAEALRTCVILAEKDPKNSYYAVFVAKAKE